MKIWLLVLALLASRHSGDTQSAHELWKINVTEKHGLQRFDRAPGFLWMKQQGIIFLGPDRVAIYQVNRAAQQGTLKGRNSSGGGGNFLLNLEVFDMRDGREISAAQFTTNAGYSRVLPTRDGGFLVRAGDLLYLYSAGFEKIATRKLDLKRTARSESWQIEVTPSGDHVVLVHQQIFLHPQRLSDGTLLTAGKSSADVEILDATTLALVKSFKLSQALPYWSPLDDALLTKDPAQDFDDAQSGLLDFDGNWKLLPPVWQSTKHSCAYVMEGLANDLVAAHGCSALMVFSVSGERILTQQARSGEIFTALTGQAHFLAAQSDEYTQSASVYVSARAARVEVFDLNTRARTISAGVEHTPIFYAVSPTGALAVVDGDTLKLYGPVTQEGKK